MKIRYWFSLKPILVSCAIGAVVSLFFNLTVGHPWAESALSGAIAGALIGIVAEGAFILTARWINRKPALSFLAVILVIAVGTALCTVFFIDAELTFTIAVIAVSEIAGVTATALFWRSSKKMNDRLAKTKKHFTG
jgi:hypothetical protein